MFSLSLEKPPRFSLDASGVLALFGGDDAVSAMTAVHVYQNRRWLGWYNNPGSFQMFSRLASFSGSASWRSIFTGSSRLTDESSKAVETDPAALLGVNSYKGPKFRAAHSGTVMEETGYLAALFLKHCTSGNDEEKVIRGRRTQPVAVTVVDLIQEPCNEMRPANSSVSTLLFSTVPIAVSLGMCTTCAMHHDLYAALLILVGIIASGVSSFIIGSADLVFRHPPPAKESPPGDGILGSDKMVILLKGKEGAVNSITRGTFTLRFENERHYYLLRCCSFLFLIQAITQLLLICQASLFGQIMFLISLGTSTLYNACLSLTDKEKIYWKFLFEDVLWKPKMTRFSLGTRTTAVVFMLLVLKPKDPEGLLNELLPNDTKVWKHWKEKVLDWLRYSNERPFQFGSNDVNLDGLTDDKRKLLNDLYGDVRAADEGYKGSFKS